MSNIEVKKLSEDDLALIEFDMISLAMDYLKGFEEVTPKKLVKASFYISKKIREKKKELKDKDDSLSTYFGFNPFRVVIAAFLNSRDGYGYNTESKGVWDIYYFCAASNVLEARTKLLSSMDDPYDIYFSFEDVDIERMYE